MIIVSLNSLHCPDLFLNFSGSTGSTGLNPCPRRSRFDLWTIPPYLVADVGVFSCNIEFPLVNDGDYPLECK